MNHIQTLIFASIFICNSALSQDQLISSGLSDQHPYLVAITSVYSDQWVTDNPEAVRALEDCFTNRMDYRMEPLTVDDKYPLLSSFPLMNKNNPAITEINYSQFDPASFSPITYCLPFFSDQPQVIRVDGTDYIIVIEPIKTQH